MKNSYLHVHFSVCPNAYLSICREGGDKTNAGAEQCRASNLLMTVPESLMDTLSPVSSLPGSQNIDNNNLPEDADALHVVHASFSLIGSRMGYSPKISVE